MHAAGGIPVLLLALGQGWKMALDALEVIQCFVTAHAKHSNESVALDQLVQAKAVTFLSTLLFPSKFDVQTQKTGKQPDYSRSPHVISA